MLVFQNYLNENCTQTYPSVYKYNIRTDILLNLTNLNRISRKKKKDCLKLKIRYVKLSELLYV